MKKLFCLLLIGTMIFTLCACGGSYSAEKFDGSYKAEFTSWSGTDTCSLNLSAGDELHIAWSLQKGSVSVSVSQTGAEPVYKADNVSAGDNPQAAFTITIPADGTYAVSLTVKNATGTLTAEK